MKELIEVESPQVKTAAFSLVILAVGLCLCVSFLKLNHAANSPEPANELSSAQRLEALEQSARKTSRTSNFIQNEKARAQATREAEEAVYGER